MPDVLFTRRRVMADNDQRRLIADQNGFANQLARFAQKTGFGERR
jgi:hypothetical protein